ncbi:MAG: hypothetical protein E7652_05695 [Ruminococcaceae bacterium]|nr:hypothetical protein [Oscillospiraceae bacterium]
MKNEQFRFAEFLNTPIMITTLDGKIVHKNPAARRCIKRPILSTNIYKYTTTGIKHTDRPVVFKLANYDTFYRTALVYTHKIKDTVFKVWVFSIFMQINDYEDICTLNLTDFAKCFEAVGDISNSYSVLHKYNTIEIPLLYAVKQLDRTEDTVGSFRVYSILTSLEKMTLELFEKRHYKINFDLGTVNPSNFYHLDFRSFSIVYTLSLLTMLKLTDSREISICFGQQSELFNMSMSFYINDDIPIKEGKISFCDIAEAYPNELLNILILDKYTSFREYTAECNVKELGYIKQLTIDLTLSLSRKDSYLSAPNQMAEKIFFERLEKLIYTQMSSMLKMLK